MFLYGDHDIHLYRQTDLTHIQTDMAYTDI